MAPSRRRANVSAEIADKEKCVAAADPAVAAYASGYFVPSSPDGHLRLHRAVKNRLHRHAWKSLAGADQSAEEWRPGPGIREPAGLRLLPAVRQPDSQSSTGLERSSDGAGFYGMSVSARNDVAMRYALGGGPATLTLTARPAWVFRRRDGMFSTSRSTGRSSIRSTASLRRAEQGYSRSYNVTVASSGLLSVVLRDRIDTTVPYGMSISAIEIAAGGGQVRCSSEPAHLPGGLVGTRYQYQFASGGVPPYTFRLTQGSLPPGMGLGFTGMLSGTPTLAGTYSFTVQVCDSTSGQRQCVSAATSITTAGSNTRDPHDVVAGRDEGISLRRVPAGQRLCVAV